MTGGVPRHSTPQPRAGAAALALALASACSAPSPPPAAVSPDQVAGWGQPYMNGPITAIPPRATPHPARAELGRRLFHDRRLSHDGSVACATCHPLDRAGVDHHAIAVGAGRSLGERNTPTVFNAALNFRQFWDGRAASLEEQIDGPINNPDEMNSSWGEVVERLRADPSYLRDFSRAYAGQITRETVRDAIGAFERTLVYQASRFDRSLAGDATALSHDERTGYELFQQLGCASCHQGANVGGNMFERLGVVRDFFGERGHPTDSDLGRYNVTGRAEDRFVFRVPSLRLVALTAPYLHDGSIATLEDTIVTMATYQLGQRLRPDEVKAIALFLATLAGTPEGIVGAATR